MKKNSFLAMLVLLVGLSSAAWGQNDGMAPVTRTFALTNVNIVPQPGEVIEKGTIVVKDGLIHAVGKNVKIPANAKTLEADSMYVYAGFIEALSQTGIPKPESNNQRGGSSRPPGATPGNPTYEQAGIQPHLKASDALSAKEKSIGDMRQLGFTAAHIVPEGRLFPGQGAIILLGGEETADMVLRDQTALFSQLVGARGFYPRTIIAIMSKWRELYKQAKQAQAHETLYKIDPKGMPRPEFDPALQAFYPVLDGDLPVFFAASDLKSIHRVLMLQKELDFPLVLAEVKQGWHVADQLKSQNIPVLLSMDLPKVEGKDKKKEKSDEKEEAKEMTMADKEKKKLEERRDAEREKHVKQAAEMAGKGINFGFSTLEVKSKDVKANLRRMIEKGLTEDQALAALTTTPAKMLGLSNMMGTVEEGKIANLVVSTAPYFEEDANVRYVFVDGSLYEYEVKKKKAAGGNPNATVNPIGAWNLAIDPDGDDIKSSLTIAADGDGFSGEFTIEIAGDAKFPLKNIELSGNNLTFDVTVPVDGQNISSSFDLVVEGESLEGSVDAGEQGVLDVKGARTSSPGADRE